jgi:hypothetical protein
MTPALSEQHVRARALRVPLFQPGTTVAAKAEQMEDYMLLSAWYLGELHDERLTLRERLKPLRDEWEDLDGWQMFQRGKTDQSVDKAKQTIAPELRQQIRDIDWQITQLTCEIERLDRDATKVSRAYTMLTGT